MLKHQRKSKCEYLAFPSFLSAVENPHSVFVEHLLQFCYFWLSANQNRCFMHTFTVPGVITNCNESRHAGQTSQGKQEANYLHCTVISTKAFFFIRREKKKPSSVCVHTPYCLKRQHGDDLQDGCGKSGRT